MKERNRRRKINRIIVCPDSFKGSLEASEVASIISWELRALLPDIEVIEIPLADGGEGTGKILSRAMGLKAKAIFTVDPAGRGIKSRYYKSGKSGVSLIESADIVGLNLIESDLRNPMHLSSFGLGTIIKDIASYGGSEIYVCLGGSGICDGGMGMLRALGFRFLDEKGIELFGKGEDLDKVSQIEKTESAPGIEDLRFKIITDVSNPLTGESGAVHVFGPQKGVAPRDLPLLEQGMINYATKAIENGFAKDYTPGLPGAGAAGGLGFAFMGFLNSEKIGGIDFVLEKTNFEKYINSETLLITGEGKTDRQSLMGKVLSGVKRLAELHGAETLVVSGKVEDRDYLLSRGVTEVYEIANPEINLKDNMKPDVTGKNLRKAIRRLIEQSLLFN